MRRTTSQTPIGRDLSKAMSWHPKNGDRISGEMNVVHSRLPNKAITPQSSSETARKEVHSLRHPRASISDGPAAPNVERVAAQTTEVSKASNTTGWTAGVYANGKRHSG